MSEISMIIITALALIVAAAAAAVYFVGKSRLRDSEEQTRIMLDSAPLCTQLWDGNMRIVDCNEAAVTLYGFSSKQEYIERWRTVCSPEYQPDGKLSFDKANEMIKIAFDKGYNRFFWMHKMPDGSPLPAEITLVRVKYKNMDAIAGYTRDMRTEKELEMQAMAAANAKTEFLARMSHEMRTPMNTIIGITQIASMSDNTDQETKKYFLEIYKASQHMLGLINGVLDVLGMEYGTFRLNMVTFDSRVMIEEIVGLASESAAEKQQEFTHDIDVSVPDSLKGDETRIKQVVTNLLVNAIKFTPEAGKINMNVRAVKKEKKSIELFFEINDNGAGINKEHIAKIFNLFEQADGSYTREFGGIGIGLSLSRRIARMMGGDISVKSSPGEGSTFIFNCILKCT